MRIICLPHIFFLVIISFPQCCIIKRNDSYIYSQVRKKNKYKKYSLTHSLSLFICRIKSSRIKEFPKTMQVPFFWNMTIFFFFSIYSPSFFHVYFVNFFSEIIAIKGHATLLKYRSLILFLSYIIISWSIKSKKRGCGKQYFWKTEKKTCVQFFSV